MNTNKNPLLAFLLSFIPGLGHLYLGRIIKGFLYGTAFISSVAIFFLIASEGGETEFLLFIFFTGVVIWIIQIIDAMYTALKLTNRLAPGPNFQPQTGPVQASLDDSDYSTASAPAMHSVDRGLIMLLSFIPGLGHFRIGMMQRGLGFIVSFFGLGVMVCFVAGIIHRAELLVFLGLLPVIWLYSMFDCMQQLERYERGEPLIDRFVFEDFEEGREANRKNKMLALVLSIFPGAGHMYLGLQKRGLQLMAAFLFSFYIMDVMRLSLFLFLVPIVWCYSLFDALQQVSKYKRGIVEDVPVVQWLIHHQRWVGFGLLALGAYYLFDQMGIPLLEKWFPEHHVSYWFNRYLQTFVVSLLLIGGGIRLVAKSYSKGGDKK